MGRKIQFRGRCTHRPEWVFGWLTYQSDIYSIIETSVFLDSHWVHPDSTGQFVRRANSKDLYEGDYDSDGNMLEWCENCTSFAFKQIDIPTGDVCFCHNCEGNFSLLEHIDEFKPVGKYYDLRKAKAKC